MERYDLNAVPNASSEKAGVLRVANSVDEKNNGCTDAAVTPSNLYKLLNYRIANTAYSMGDSVAVPYHPHLMLTCYSGGSTAAGSLDTTNVTVGERITDGTVIWVVEEIGKVKSVNGKTGDVIVDLPLGFMYFTLEKEVPVGRLPAQGALYNRSLYADLWAYAQEHGLVKSESEWQAIASTNGGNCAYYSSGDGSSTFRVPKLPTTIVTNASNGEVPVVGNGMTLGVTDGTNFGGWGQASDDSGALRNLYGTPVGTARTGAYINNCSIGITTDPTKSGIVAQTSATKITGRWLIVAFGVAHNIGEADVANVMQAVEQVQSGLGATDNKITGIVDYIVESYRNGTEWYEVYKSGKIRQGGTVSTSSRPYTVTFPKAFKTKIDFVISVPHHNTNNSVTFSGLGHSITLTNFVFDPAGSSDWASNWIAEGV